METNTIICGSGGQGILLAAGLLAYAGVKEGKNVTWLPSYGAEKRGGLSFCAVCISDEEIASPWIDRASTIIALDNIGFNVYENSIAENGLIILNSSLIKREIKKKAEILKVPLNEIAAEIGNPRVMNILSVGVYIGKTKIVKLETAVLALEKVISKKHRNLLEINKTALEKGFKIGSGKE